MSRLGIVLYHGIDGGSELKEYGRIAEGIVNLFALRQSPGRRMGGHTSSAPQAARAGTVISRQIWNLCVFPASVLDIRQ